MLSNDYVEKKPSLRKDLFANVVLTVGVGFLALIALRPAVMNTAVEAQSPTMNLYIEPGTIAIRTPDSGGTQGEGKMVIDLKTGDVWGFPTNSTGSPYPIDATSKKPPMSKPVYLGRFDFSEMKAP